MNIPNGIDERMQQQLLRIRTSGVHAAHEPWWKDHLFLAIVIGVTTTILCATWIDLRDHQAKMENAVTLPTPVAAAPVAQVPGDGAPPYKIFSIYFGAAWEYPTVEGYVYVGSVAVQSPNKGWGTLVFERFDVYERKMRSALPAAPAASRPAFDVEQESGK